MVGEPFNWRPQCRADNDSEDSGEEPYPDELAEFVEDIAGGDNNNEAKGPISQFAKILANNSRSACGVHTPRRGVFTLVFLIFFLVLSVARGSSSGRRRVFCVVPAIERRCVSRAVFTYQLRFAVFVRHVVLSNNTHRCRLVMSFTDTQVRHIDSMSNLPLLYV